jgi:hypothetical protein
MGEDRERREAFSAIQMMKPTFTNSGFRWYAAGRFTKKFTQFRLDLIGVILCGVILFRKDSYILFGKLIS